MILDLVISLRSRLASLYSGEFHHSLARSTLSKRTTAMRSGFQSPTSDSTLPPRTM